MKIRHFIPICTTALAITWLLGCASQKNPRNVTNIPGMRSAPTGSSSAAIGAPIGAPFNDDFALHPSSRGRDLNDLIAPSPLAHYVGEELWIIHRPAQLVAARDDQYPGTGSLMTRIAEREVPLPLKHTDVKANVTAYIASVDVTQQFENPYSEKIEAVYVFPLPENGAVNELVMQIGLRRIRGIVREREEAERIYQEAKHQGYVASLLTQERPNIFTQSVACSYA